MICRYPSRRTSFNGVRRMEFFSLQETNGINEAMIGKNHMLLFLAKRSKKARDRE